MRVKRADDPAVLRAVASLVAPPLCALCGRPCDYVDRICGCCERRVGKLRATRATLPDGLEVLSAAPYEGVARELVAKMKFASRLTLAEVAAERMVRAWGATRSEWMVSVPPAPARERVRGYDMAYVLARLVARKTACSQVSVCIGRDDGPRQVGRRRSERLSDPPRIRLLSSKVRLPANDLWLVDDVVTTGATLMACARVLRDAGAKSVRALTFARADSLGARARAA